MRRRVLEALAAVVLAAGLAVPAAAAAPSVLYLGDSITVGMRPYLVSDLRGLAVRVDARVGRPTPEGIDHLRGELRPSDEIVAFDLGTNDSLIYPGAFAARLRTVRRLTGSRCLVVATLNRPPAQGGTIQANNTALESFAAGYANVVLVPWHEEVQRRPGLLGPDHIHPTPQGARYRAALMSQAVMSCLGRSQSVTPPAVSPPATGAPQTLTLPEASTATPTTIAPAPAAPRRRHRAAPKVAPPTLLIVYPGLYGRVDRAVRRLTTTVGAGLARRV